MERKCNLKRSDKNNMAINVHMFFFKFNAMLQYYDEFKVTLNCLHLKNANAIPKSALAVRLLTLDIHSLSINILTLK